MLVSSCMFKRVGCEVTRVWAWALLGLNGFGEAEESASDWPSAEPCISIGEERKGRQIDDTAQRAWRISTHVFLDLCTCLECSGLAAREDWTCWSSASEDTLLSPNKPGGNQLLLVNRCWRKQFTSQYWSTSFISLFMLRPTLRTPLHIQGSCCTKKSCCFYCKLLKFSLQLLKPWVLLLSSFLRTSSSVTTSLTTTDLKSSITKPLRGKIKVFVPSNFLLLTHRTVMNFCLCSSSVFKLLSSRVHWLWYYGLSIS